MQISTSNKPPETKDKRYRPWAERWLIVFVGSVDYQDDIDRIQKNFRYTLDGKRRIEYRRIPLKGVKPLSGIGDFKLYIYNEAYRFNKEMSSIMQVAIVIDRATFANNDIFDEVIKSQRPNSYYMFYCNNRYAGDNFVGNSADCEAEYCADCDKRPSECRHECKDRLMNRLRRY